MNLTLHVWRQKGPQAKGKLETYQAKNVSPDQSFWRCSMRSMMI